MLRLSAVVACVFVVLANAQIIMAAGSDVLEPLLAGAQASICVPSIENCANNVIETYRSPNYHSAEYDSEQQVANMSHSSLPSAGDAPEPILFGPQKPRLALRLYYVVKSKDFLLFGVAVMCTVLAIRMLVVPGRVWGRFYKLGGHFSSLIFWAIVAATAVPPALSLCFISGATFMMIGVAMLFLLLRQHCFELRL